MTLDGNGPTSSNHKQEGARSGGMNKVIAVVVFLVLIFMGTYFAKVSQGGAGSVFIGYTLGAAAFIVAPMIWKSKK